MARTNPGVTRRRILDEAIRLSALRSYEERVPDDPREALRMMARAVWDVIDGDRDLVRIMLRRVHHLPGAPHRSHAG
jgi:hypothetical protein